MLKRTLLCAAICAPLCAQAADDEELRALRDEVNQLQQRVDQSAAAQPPASNAGAFNPATSLILEGTYGNLQRDPAIPATGFALSPNDNGEVKGFSLQESELGIMANIDPQFSGVATFALHPAGGVSVENAFVQATTLGNGFNLKFGRFFSGLGYLNEQHAHTWDFVDQPLVYRVFWDNQLDDDGIQLKWLAPTDVFLEFGAELGSGNVFPGANQQHNGAGASTLFAHVGDDVGVSSSWRAGASLHQTRQSNFVSTGVPDLAGTPGGVTDSFSGSIRTAGLDFIWKYAPEGNATVTNFKLQGEYFRRTQSGVLTYALLTTDGYAVTQSGWYVQSVYQFMPMWRAGVRYDRLDSGIAQVGALNAANVISDYGYTPRRTTLMLDYSPSEFSRIRLQAARDQSRQGLTDNQLFVQYIMSMGAHGAHQF
jgi:hypothetical protein